METIQVTKSEFDRLLVYNLSYPTGKAVGKRWKTWFRGYWYLCEFVESLTPGTIGVARQLIEVKGEGRE